MTQFKPITDTLFASGQIEPGDVERAKAEGVTLIVNNRPDGEETGQPEGREIEEAARQAGMEYAAIPVGSAGFSLPQVDAMAAAIGNSEGKVLAFCRTGTRSTLLWAMTQAKAGRDLETIAREAQAAGYDISPVRPTLEMLSQQSGD